MSDQKTCMHCGLPIFQGAVSTTLPQCQCRWATKYPEHAVGKLSYEQLEHLNAALRSQVAELTKDRDEWKESCIDANQRFKDAEQKVRELQAKLDEAANQGEDSYVGSVEQYDGEFMMKFADVYSDRLPPGTELYRLPPNLTALIEQAKAEERESALKVMRHAAAALAHAAESNPLYQDAYNEIDAAIRERKP